MSNKITVHQIMSFDTPASRSEYEGSIIKTLQSLMDRHSPVFTRRPVNDHDRKYRGYIVSRLDDIIKADEATGNCLADLDYLISKNMEHILRVDLNLIDHVDSEWMTRIKKSRRGK